MPELIIFVFGLAVGSFLNVLIDRLPRDESVIKGRSYCERCKKPLLWYDLIPLLSFVVLKRKCRHCHCKLSWQYPLVEGFTGVIYVITTLFVVNNFQFFPPIAGSRLGGTIFNYVYYLFIVSSLIVIFFSDLKYGIIPDKIVYPAILISLIYLFMIHNSLFLIHILSAFGAFLFFLLLYLGTKGRGMGFGDVKLVFLLGLILGYPKVIVAFYIAFLTGAIFGCILVLWRKKKLTGGTIPFGPFLVLGAIIALFWGEQIFLKVARAIL